LHPGGSGAGSGCGAAQDLPLIFAPSACAAARVSTPPPAPEPQRHNTQTGATLAAGTAAAPRISACAWTLAASWRICRTSIAVAELRTAAPLRSQLACMALGLRETRSSQHRAETLLRRAPRRLRCGVDVVLAVVRTAPAFSFAVCACGGVIAHLVSAHLAGAAACSAGCLAGVLLRPSQAAL